jgi:fumarate reductase subunit D
VRVKGHPGHWAFLAHRVSGILLVLFLPGHFVALGSALEGAAAFDAFLAWTERPAVKFAEWGIVLLLAAHLGGGLRVMALELLPWRDWQKTLAALAAAASVAAGLAFALALQV